MKVNPQKVNSKISRDRYLGITEDTKTIRKTNLYTEGLGVGPSDHARKATETCLKADPDIQKLTDETGVKRERTWEMSWINVGVVGGLSPLQI